MFTKRARVFFLASGRLTVYDFRRGRVLDPVVFVADEDGLRGFSSFLDRAPDVPSYMLVDVVEEEFREETVPHVHGPDRRALVRNRKNRLFRDPRFTQALFQGREPAGRRDDRMLFTGLIRPDLLAPWLAQISRHKVPLFGIYSVPLLSEALLKRIPIRDEQVLLVSLQSSGGLRQTFFRERKITISRLAVLPQVAAEHYAGYVVSEVDRIKRYLGSAVLASPDRPLDVYVLCHGPLLDDLGRQLVDSPMIRHHLLDTADVGARVGVRGTLDTPWADLIFARLLIHEPRALSYGGREETRYATMYRLRRAMVLASVLALVWGAGWGALKFAEGAIAGQEAAALDQQADFYTERYHAAERRLPPRPADAREVKDVVQMAETFLQERASPLPVMEAVSTALDRYPDVQLDELRWVVSDDPKASAMGPAPSSEAPDARRRRARPSANGKRMLYDIVRVRGHLAGFDGDYRRAMRTVSAFADALKQNPAVEEVTLITLPLDLSSQQSLQGSASAQTKTATAAFDVRVVMRAKSDAPG